MWVVKKYQKIFFWLATVAALLFGAQQVLSLSDDDGAAPQPPGDLLINEFLAANQAGLSDEDGDYPDWIEIYNRTSQPVNLSGWALSDDAAQPAKWTFPNITLAGGEYLLVFASGKDRKPLQAGAELHTNFKLNRDGEPLLLYNILDDALTDGLMPFPAQFRDSSYGRYRPGPGGEGAPAYAYLGRPTPGGPNDQTQLWPGLVSPVQFSVERGFYETPFTVELKSATPGAIIRYTTDGSEPSETDGLLYSGPINVTGTTLLRAAAFKANFLPSPANSHTYLFLDEVLAQPAEPAGFPVNWGVHSRNYEAFRKGEPVGADYEMDPQIVNDPLYGRTLKDDLLSIPSLSIVTDIRNFDIYGAPRATGTGLGAPRFRRVDRPRPARPGLSGQCRPPHSGSGRPLGIHAQTFLPPFLQARVWSGHPGLSSFPDSPVEEFNTLVLRGGVGESYAGHPGLTPDFRTVTYARDEWLRASQIALSGIGSHGIFVHLYLNGLYWGLYNLVERPDAAFLASYLGGSKENYTAINHSGLISGSADRFEALQQLFREDDLAAPETYARLKSYLDTTHFSDYLILNWYAGNVDWLQKNWYVGYRNPSGRIKYFVWDGEGTWAEGARMFWEKPDRLNIAHPLFEALIQNADFKMELADRLYKHLYDEGELSDARSQARWLKITAQINRAIVAESARWGDARYDRPITRADWLKARDAILAQMDGNTAKLIALAREAGYYPPIDPPTFNRRSGLVPPGFNLTMTHPTPLSSAAPSPPSSALPSPLLAASSPLSSASLSSPPLSPLSSVIYFTTDGTDPRLQGTGAIAPSARPYTAPLVLTTTTRIKARVLIPAQAGSTGSGPDSEQIWSALNEATFRIVEPDHKLRLTELMYNPRDGSDYEFIELKNTGQTAFDLSAMAFEGINFTFPPNTPPLRPGEFIILARNAEALGQRYPGLTVSGLYSGKLSNQGEQITLKDAAGRPIISLDYDDENGWPISPDGRGDSLVLDDADKDPADPKSWRASTHLNGSPGRDDPAP